MDEYDKEYDEDWGLDFEYGYRYEEEADLDAADAGFMRGYMEA